MDHEEDALDAERVGHLSRRWLLECNEDSAPAREPQGLLHKGSTDGVKDKIVSPEMKVVAVGPAVFGTNHVDRPERLHKLAIAL